MDGLRSLSSQSYRIIALALLTGLIHLFLGAQYGDMLFILNGLGYFALVVALYLLPQLANSRSYIRWALLAYAAVTIVAYFIQNPEPLSSGFGLLTKAIEVILIVLLFLEQRLLHAH